MEEWKEYKLGDVCENIYSGGTPSTTTKEFWNGGLPWLSSGETGQRYIYSTEKTITKLGAEKSSTRYAYKDSTVVASAGQGYTRGQASYLTIDTYINQSVIVLKPNTNIINSKFLYFNIDNRYAELRQLSDGTSTRGSLSGKIMKDLTITLPPLSTQKKIAAVLSSLDDKIELNRQINANLELQAQAIFKNWFVDFEEKNKNIGDYIVPKRGKSLLSKDAIFGEVPVIAGGLEPATYHNVSNTKEPVITISASGANAGFVNLWNIPVWSSDSSYIDATMTEDVYFWYVMLKTRQKEIFDSQTGSAQPHIYPQHIQILPVAELNMNKVHEFSEMVKPMFKTIGENQKENNALASIRDTLLPKLMSGKLQVD